MGLRLVVASADLTSRQKTPPAKVAARVQNLAGGDEICITENVHDAAGVAEIVAPHAMAKSASELRGVRNAMSVYHLARRAS
jgi:class 3 adenylate cyclase